MNKKRIYKFKLEDGNFEEIESLGYKKAVKKFSSKPYWFKGSTCPSLK